MDATRRLRARLADPRLTDAAVVAACLILTAFAVKARWTDLPRPLIAAAGTAGGLAQWPRRRHPLIAAVTGAAAYALSGNPGPLLTGLYAGASYAPRRHLWIVLPAGWAGLAAWSWIAEGTLTAPDATWAALGTLAVTAVGVHTATRRDLATSWRQRAESAEAERLLREEQARAAERTRIAREMHDVLAHKVSLIALHAGALELTTTGTPANQGAALIRVTAREALQELRYVLGVLRTEPGSNHPRHDEPFADLTSLVRASTDAGQHVELADHAGPLPPAMARVVYRVAQEGLTNARKHAPDAPAAVSVDRDDTTVTVTVHNTPPAGPPADLPGSGSGLVGLAERVRLVGGTLHAGPPAGEPGGWRLRAVLPWPDPEGTR
ncbi:sensor histidine kinase [Sphaerisporangium corydalis]|uniref:histidine kinase n=1 Tax=Sphaerisporangium corydalis TaxID=1441875 RepID=A0ABV9EDT4_9ACTN|nr:histidine kinase [Sphaerisporangium corydalis]